jgi:hypothetical protein
MDSLATLGTGRGGPLRYRVPDAGTTRKLRRSVHSDVTEFQADIRKWIN